MLIFFIQKKEVDLYSALFVVPHTQGAQVWITHFTCNCTNACLYLVSVHQMAPPLRLRTSNRAYYSIIYPERMKGWVGVVGWPTADGLPISGHPVSCRSSAKQGKFAGQSALCQATNALCSSFRHFKCQILNRRNSQPETYVFIRNCDRLTSFCF